MSTPLEAAAAAFRLGTEEYVRNDPSSPLKHFEASCCKATAFLLARYVAARGFGHAELVANRRRHLGDQTETHACLQLAGTTIDITASQLGLEYPAVIVGARAPLHATFSGVTIHA